MVSSTSPSMRFGLIRGISSLLNPAKNTRLVLFTNPSFHCIQISPIPQLPRLRFLSTSSFPLLSQSSTTAQERPHFQKGSQQETEKNNRTGILLGALVIFVLGGAYAAVPLYRLFCQATGYAGTTQRGDTVSDLLTRAAAIPAEKRRPINIYFVSEVSAHLPWTFTPLQRSVSVLPGESALAFFQATNDSDDPLIGVATYNVAPSKAGAYFHKIQCFCFDEQRLEPHESVDMPVLFYLDPELLKDPKLENLDHITLSYTFFNSGGDIEDEEEEAPDLATEAAPNP